MSVQITNTVLGVRRVDPDAVDAHGSPLTGTPGPASALRPGKATELDTGQWQLALDPTLWPVRVGDFVIDDAGGQWVATFVKLLPTPPLTTTETVPGADMDVSFIRVMGNQVTPVGTEPTDAQLAGRVGYGAALPEAGFASQPFGDGPFGGSA